MSALSGLFTIILNMSITATYVAAGVILVRLLLRKAPKILSYALWAVVLFRLICPLSFTSTVSFLGLLNINPQDTAGVLEYVPHNLGFMPEPTVQSGIGSLDSAVNSSLPAATPRASVNPMQIWIDVLSLIWLAGIIVLVLYSVISYVKIKRKLLTATLVKDNIYESDRIGTAFVCGFVHPKIYVPVGVADADLSYILEHERTHIQRYDYLIKPLAFFALILHWFNPLMWLSFALMSRDLEMSCDERVLDKMNPEAKGCYSSSLLALSVKSNGLFAANPLAFGESHVKARIKNVLNYKKPAFWVIVLAVIATVILIVAFTTNPKHEQPAPNSYKGYSIDALMDKKTPYVGNNVKVIGLIDAMPLPEGILRDKVELQTAKVPYGITINYIMNDSSNVMVNGAISGEAFYRNAIMLFSLIDNVDVINCVIADKTGVFDGASYVLTYTREMAEELIGQEVRPFAASAETLKNLIDRITNTPLGANIGFRIDRLYQDFYQSVKYDPSQDLLSFTIPEIIPGGKVYLHVSGRLYMGDKSNGMSWHALDEETQNYGWESGKTYTYSLDAENLDEYMLDFGLIDTNDQELLYTIHVYTDGTKKLASSEKLLSYIESYDEKTKMLTFDEIEWVIQGDAKRVGELGLDANLDFPNGFYIYNENDETNTLRVSDDVKVYLVNWHDLSNHTLTDVNGLAERMAEYQAPYHLTIEDGVVVEILEQYTP